MGEKKEGIKKRRIQKQRRHLGRINEKAAKETSGIKVVWPQPMRGEVTHCLNFLLSLIHIVFLPQKLTRSAVKLVPLPDQKSTSGTVFLDRRDAIQ